MESSTPRDHASAECRRSDNLLFNIRVQRGSGVAFRGS